MLYILCLCSDTKSTQCMSLTAGWEQVKSPPVRSWNYHRLHFYPIPPLLYIAQGNVQNTPLYPYIYNMWKVKLKRVTGLCSGLLRVGGV